jgi:hypothetical protein
VRDPYRHVLIVASAAADADAKAAPKPLPRFTRRVDGCGCGQCREALKLLATHRARWQVRR